MFMYSYEPGPKISMAKLRDGTTDEEEVAFTRLGLHVQQCHFCKRTFHHDPFVMCVRGQALADSLLEVVERNCAVSEVMQ